MAAGPIQGPSSHQPNGHDYPPPLSADARRVHRALSETRQTLRGIMGAAHLDEGRATAALDELIATGRAAIDCGGLYGLRGVW